MKPIYKSVILTQATLAVSLSLQANVYSGDATATQAVPAESLQGLRVQLVSPNVSGARDLIASGECTIDGATLNVNLNAAGLIQGTHRLVVKAEFGTQTVVLYGLDIYVPASFEEGDAQEFEDTITVVSTIGDGGESTVVDTEITEESQNPVTSAAIYAALEGKADTFTTDATPTEDSTNTVQSGGVYSVLEGKQPVGNYADGAVYGKDGDGNAHITKPLSIGDGVVSGDGAIASGYAGDGASIQASGAGAIASGQADATLGNVSASGQASQAFGIGTKTQTDGQMVLGKCNVVDEDGEYALIVGNGADDQNRSNAFAIDWNGNLVLFNAGTPVVLTPAKLATLIA